MIDGRFTIKDDGHKVVDWSVWNMFNPQNGDPAKYWIESTCEIVVAPGTNLFLIHLFPLSVNFKKKIRKVMLKT